MSNHESFPSHNPEVTENEPRFPDDPNQYTEAELLADPAKRFHVNPADFPIFAQQADQNKTLSVNESLSRHVTSTADTIAVIDGSSEKYPKADHVVYLDKSARPVSWLVNTFWTAFSDQKRPPHSYLAIDRAEWLQRSGVTLQPGEYIKEADGSERLATFSDFQTDKISREDIARIRALYIPGGIESEDVDAIMNTPTGLEGKNITIIDEVSRSGATANIAKWLLSQAIPEAAEINTYIYWHPSPGKINSSTGEIAMGNTPVWYPTDHSVRSGRGIGDVNPDYFEKRYNEHPTPKTLAQKFGSIALGQFIDLGKEIGQPSRKLAHEIQLMRKEYDAGHILPSMPNHYDEDAWIDHCESLGIEFVPADRAKGNKKAYLNVREKIEES